MAAHGDDVEAIEPVLDHGSEVCRLRPHGMTSEREQRDRGYWAERAQASNPMQRLQVTTHQRRQRHGIERLGDHALGPERDELFDLTGLRAGRHK